MWYLPLFGVYHPKTPDQIRGVFDDSAKFQGISLNDVLLPGPDLANNLVGILFRFRKNQIAISADIKQMFYNFLVAEKHRDYLRFFWFSENDPSEEFVEYRMRVHVFGNRPSPAVANFGLRKTAAVSETEYGKDVHTFVSDNFYVDDGLTSTATEDTAVSLMKRTQIALRTNGGIHLHKIASNSKQVLAAFPAEDLAKGISNLELSKDDLPVQRSLGLLWNLNSDCFTFQVSDSEKPFTRRGVLSVVNSLYDPLGFVASVTINGKILLQKMNSEKLDWDEPLPKLYLAAWKDWSESLQDLQNLHVPRTYFSDSFSESSSYYLLLFSDASEKAIASVVYIVCQRSGSCEISFVMGKTKVAPSKGHTIPRLELCAAVLSVNLYEFVVEHLDVKIERVYFYTDSKVTLGYICNRTRRFYTYVSNRVQYILKHSSSDQWSYVETSIIPADVGSRGLTVHQVKDSVWLKGPPSSLYVNCSQEHSDYPLLDPQDDKEIRPEVFTLATKVDLERPCSLGSVRFDRFSSWKSLSRAVSVLQHIARSYSRECSCHGWHICFESSLSSNVVAVQTLIIRIVQQDYYRSEILKLLAGEQLPQNSSLASLNPFIDNSGILKVGGRLKHADISSLEKNPIIIPGKSHLAVLLIRHFHEKVQHQGGHFTEGAAAL